MNKHLVFVPGFGGFDILGSLRYYEGVLDAMRRAATASGTPLPRIHFFRNLPAASVTTRARALAVFLEKRRARNSIVPGEEVHLVTHSTGGLDVLRMIFQLRAADDPCGRARSELLDSIRSIQLISAPLRGTGLAVWGWRHRCLLHTTVRLLSCGLRAARAPGTALAGHALRLCHRRAMTPDFMDAAFDTLAQCYATGDDFDRAEARRRYYDLMLWLHHAAADAGAADDLLPVGALRGECVETPARWAPEVCDDLHTHLVQAGVKVRAIVTAAEPRAAERGASCFDLFRYWHGVIARERAVPATGATLPEIMTAIPVLIAAGMNDGIVDSTSMVWGSKDDLLVRCDHADIIGHYEGAGSGRPYDLLVSDPRFGGATFDEVWRRVLAYV